MRNERFVWLAVALLGALVSGYATGNGVGVSMDSISYLRGAESIARADGYAMTTAAGVQPIDHWPPLYSMAIALPIAAGASTVQAVRIVNAAALFALLYLSALLVRRLSPGGRLAPVFAMCVLLVAPVVLRNYVMAWSEALFTPLILLGFLAMHDYFARDRVRDLIAAGVWFGLAAVDRYSGVAFVGAVAASLLVRDLKHPVGGRFRRPLLFCVAAGLPMAVWLIRNFLVMSRVHDRPFVPQLPSIDHVRAAVESVTRWLLPAWIPLWVRVAWVALIIVLIAMVLTRNHASVLKRIAHELSGRVRFWTLALACIAAYLAFVLLTIVLFDFDVQFDGRMLSPIFVLLVIFAAALAPAVFARPASVPARVIAAAAVLSVALLAGASVRYVRAAHDDPEQFASDRWCDARAWDVVRDAPADARVYSSSPYVSAYFLDRAVAPLPSERAQLEAIVDGEPGLAYVLWYPGENGPLGAEAHDILHTEVVDSTETVILYSIRP